MSQTVRISWRVCSLETIQRRMPSAGAPGYDETRGTTNPALSARADASCARSMRKKIGALGQGIASDSAMNAMFERSLAIRSGSSSTTVIASEAAAERGGERALVEARIADRSRIL